MIQIDDKIISLDILENHFLCDLNSCKGSCCVEGDSGAPLEKEEAKEIKKLLPSIKPFMSGEGVGVVNHHGVSLYDEDGDLTTPLINNKQCAFVIFEKGIAKCSIEKAYNANKIKFKKPISCHLFPIRVTNYKNFQALNYEKIKICNEACELGEKSKLPMYVFLKEALIRKYGEKFYDDIIEVAKKLFEK
tara:strand:+ start:625 stop:1194 length:570 start_codon:yes stop_codon:yes gene_type:complete